MMFLRFASKKDHAQALTQITPSGTILQRLLPNFQQTNFDPAQGQMPFAYYQLEQKMATKETYRLYTLRAGMYTSLK